MRACINGVGQNLARSAAGIAIGPELVMPSEWLPVVWGGEEPVFADGDQAQAVLGAIMSRYNEILRQVEEGSYEPLLWVTPDETVIAADWAEGFVLAIGMRPEAWDPLLRSRRHAPFLLPILSLCGDENGESALGLNHDAEDELAREAPSMIPACVGEITRFWRTRRAAARIVIKTGRNHTCPSPEKSSKGAAGKPPELHSRGTGRADTIYRCPGGQQLYPHRRVVALTATVERA